MIRQMVRSAALFAAGLLLANAAWGQPVLTQVSSDAQLVAAEYFGGEARMVQVSKMDLVADDTADTTTQGVQRPYVGLNLSGADITDGNTADITFTLTGATFDQPASPTNLDQRLAAEVNGNSCSGPALDVIEATVVSGGERGDSSVTYRVEVTDTGDADFTASPSQAICFWIPDLSVTLANVDEATPPTRGVTVKATAIKPVASTGTPFPAAICGAPTTMPANPCPMPSGAEVRVLQATPALTASLGMGDTAYVAITDRTKIATHGTRDPSASDPASATMGLRVGSLSVGVSQMDIWELDGSGFLPKDAVDGSLSGQIDLSVGGRYQSGDKVVVGSGPTALSADIDGRMAEVTVQTAVIAGMPIVYVPGGVDALKPGTFTAAGAHLFNDRRNANGPFGMSQGEIKYAGIDVEGYAYGVVRGGGTDRSFVRVTCETAAPCAIFADCTGQDGMEYFEAAPPIPGGATVAWNSDDIEGLMGDDWTNASMDGRGRGRCDVLSNGELSVQHMLSRGDALVNSSAVVGRSLDLRADRARAQIDMVVDNICDSVVGHYGRTADFDSGTTGIQTTQDVDDGNAVTNNDISGHAATKCKNALARVIPNDTDTNNMGTDDATDGT